MLSRWYLILFIISLLVLLIIIGYNIYENWRVKRDCPETCQESQVILIWLNGLALFLILVLLFGYLFSDDSTCKKMPTSTINILGSASGTNGMPLSNGVQNSNMSLQGYSPIYFDSVNCPRAANSLSPTTPISATSMNPFNYGTERIDIISKL